VNSKNIIQSIVEKETALINKQAVKRRIRQNIWGNWKGYEGSRKVHDFGTDEVEAKRWMSTGETH
jgi:hypothetical protein